MSKAFFLKALEPLGVAVVFEGPPGVELSRPTSTASLWMCQAEQKPARLHLAFAAENCRQVEAFHRAGRAVPRAGGAGCLSRELPIGAGAKRTAPQAERDRAEDRVAPGSAPHQRYPVNLLNRDQGLP